jgi:uncharacterized phiE125 gp8 family phage protein
MSPIGAKIITRETARLLSIETLRQHCEVVTIDTDSDGVESNPDDDLLLAYLDAATDHAERFTGRALLLRTYEFALDEFPRWRTGALCREPSRLHPGIEIPYPPLIEALTFTYGDDSDSELELATDYLVDDYGDKAVLRPVTSWPSTVTPYPNIVKFRYRAGYSSEVDPDSDALPLPGGIKAAVLLTVAHLYANREASVEKAMQELPLGVEALLRPWRVLTGMA